MSIEKAGRRGKKITKASFLTESEMKSRKSLLGMTLII